MISFLVNIRRYFKLYKKLITFSASKGLEFRFDFYTRILMDLIYYLVSILFFKILFLHSSNVGGWTESQTMVFVGGFLFIDAIHMTIFSNNLWQIPMLINKGELDYYLIKPVSSLFLISFRDFAFNSLINLFFSIGILIWAIFQLPVFPSYITLFIYILFLLNGAIIFYCLHMFGNLVVFWLHSSDDFRFITWQMMKFGERPDKIYYGFGRKILITLLPYGVIASFPARIILDEFDWLIIIHCLSVSVVFLCVLYFIWKKGLKNYSSASS